MTRHWLILACVVGATACGTNIPPDDGDQGPQPDAGRPPFQCLDLESRDCREGVHFSCELNGEFLSAVQDDCAARGEVCIVDLGCRRCVPDTTLCEGNDVVQCNEEGTDTEFVETCDLEAGFACDSGECVNLCERALRQRSYEGCEFYGVDLDNAAIQVGRDASSQVYAVVVSNPGNQPTEVWVEQNTVPFGVGAPDVEELERITLLPGDLEVFELPRREVDGSSSFFGCFAQSECPLPTEGCFCNGGLTPEDEEPPGGHRGCRCRVEAGSNALNDGTHSATTSQAYRIRSVLPVIAYQFNPLENVDVFSNDASLLLPTSGIGVEYMINGWPQTIANSLNVNEDFDPNRSDEDLRAALTIVGTAPNTRVEVTFGPLVRNVVPVNGEGPSGRAGDTWNFDIGPFDVVNLETGGFNADFTGTTVSSVTSDGGSGAPVSVFIGSEASDAPRFDVLQNRQCCADHLEEQAFPTDTLGRRFFVGHMPSRATSLNNALIDPLERVGEAPEPESIRVLAVDEGLTTITTSLPPPDNQFSLERGESVIIRSEGDFEINASRAVSVLQVLPSQGATPVTDPLLPGGDPAIMAVPSLEQYRQEYVFLTPSLYAFDYVVITARRGVPLLLDEEPLSTFNCEEAPADGLERGDDDDPPEWVVYRCQLTFPEIETSGVAEPLVLDGDQTGDGFHTLRAPEREVAGLLVYGFDRFVSYGYAGGLNLDPLD